MSLAGLITEGVFHLAHGSIPGESSNEIASSTSGELHDRPQRRRASSPSATSTGCTERERFGGGRATPRTPCAACRCAPPTRRRPPSTRATTYYFCSDHCRERFEADPARFAGEGAGAAPDAASADTATDPVCGMSVDPETRRHHRARRAQLRLLRPRLPRRVRGRSRPVPGLLARLTASGQAVPGGGLDRGGVLVLGGLHPSMVEVTALARAVATQGPLGARRVGAHEDPVLPGRTVARRSWSRGSRARRSAGWPPGRTGRRATARPAPPRTMRNSSLRSRSSSASETSPAASASAAARR